MTYRHRSSSTPHAFMHLKTRNSYAGQAALDAEVVRMLRMLSSVKSFEGNDDKLSNESGMNSLQLTNPSGHHGQRRESFLYRSDSEYEIAPPKSTSRHSSIASEGAIHEDVIVTPFAQILQTLRTVRNNFMFITNVSPSRSRSGSQAQAIPTNKNNNITDEDGTRLAYDTLEELDWCLEQLENMHTHRSVGDLASLKFRKMLGRELTAFEASSAVSGGSTSSRVSEFIINTYLDKEQELDIPSPKNPDKTLNQFTIRPVTTEQTEPANTHKFLSKVNSLGGVPECPQDIPLSGVQTAHQTELMAHLNKIDDWGIDIFKIDELSNSRPLTCVTYTILKKRNLLSTFQINPQALVTYLMHLEAHYHRDVPYHNNIHAADVVQSAHVLLNANVLKPIFNELEILATIFACAVHDVDHPGFTNQFLVQSDHELARLYNDSSVLENHHISLAFQLLKDEGCNAFSKLSSKQWQTFRKMAIDMVLATDMSKHMSLLADLKTMVETKKVAAAYELKLDNYIERIQVLQNMVHCADLSNPTKPNYFYKNWTRRITEEFFRQGEEEKRLNLTISPMCDKPTSDSQLVETVARTQIGFISYVVHPLWETWDDLVSNANDQLTHLETNRKYYDDQYKKAVEVNKASDPSTSQSDNKNINDSAH